jgi:tetrahydromethanopterin S-methyltransferase subunit B
LERENELLTEQVQEITEELERSRAYIDKLLKKKDYSDSDWESKEREYKQVINNLRARVRGGEAVVSLAVYRKAVDEARARALECQDKRLAINVMTRKLNDLERRLNNDRHKVQTSRTPLDVQPTRANLHKVAPLPSPVHSTENSNPNTPKSTRMSKSKSVRPPPPPSPPVAYRISAVREAGGRAGLRAKLKHMRRSPLANKNVSLR